MTPSAKIYGFGSFFKGDASFRDVDLIIIHENISAESVHFAIKCKALCLNKVHRADVVVLSAAEEQEKGILERSKASLLCEIELGGESVAIDLLARDLNGRLKAT